MSHQTSSIGRARQGGRSPNVVAYRRHDLYVAEVGGERAERAQLAALLLMCERW